MTKSKELIKNNLKTASVWKKPWFYLVVLLILVGLAFMVYQLPPIRNRVDTVLSKIYYKIKPPSAAVFSPSEQGTIEAIIQLTQTASTASATEEPTFPPVEAAEPVTDEPGTAVPSATPTPFPVPSSFAITGMGLEYQSFNNCGPANVSMNLNFWNHPTNQEETRSALRTHEDDRNVMLSEMRDYINANTSLMAVLRYGGDLQVLKALVSGGYPLLLERGHTDPKDGWMGHYTIIHAYDDSTQTVTSNDTLLGTITLSYDELMKDWRHFDGIYIVVFPKDREDDVMARLGLNADPELNLQLGLAEVEARIPQESGRELFFAWYSKGQFLVEMGEFVAAAQAFDRAFAIYGQLDVSAYGRPWRMTWYQIGPYLAYYHSGRFQDTLALAQQTLDNSREPRALPETYYWAGMAAAALGQNDEARAYFNKALEYHPNWQDVLTALNGLP